MLGPLLELCFVLAADAAGADAHPPLGVLRSLEDALLHETLLPERLEENINSELLQTLDFLRFCDLIKMPH